MTQINLCHSSSEFSYWLRRDPGLACQMGLTTGDTQDGEVPEEELTLAGRVLFGATGCLEALRALPELSEVGAWMILEEGWSKKSRITLRADVDGDELRIFYPSPLSPSTCTILRRFLAMVGYLSTETADRFFSQRPLLKRELVISDPTPIVNLTLDGEKPSPRPPFHPFVRWVLQA